MKKLFTLFTMMLVFAANVAAESVTLQYSGTETGNMTGENDAATVGLDAAKWSVVADKGGNNNFPGLNKAGDIRLYWHANGGNTITVTSLENATINSITITFTGASYNNVSVTAGGSTITGTDGVYNINASSFVLGNANTSNIQVRIKTIVIDYSASTDTRTATSIDFSGGYVTKFTYGPNEMPTLPTATVKANGSTVSGAAVTWAVEKVSGNDKLIPTINGNKIEIPNQSYGKVKVTATYAGDATYQGSSKSYNIDVYKGRINIREILEDLQRNVTGGEQSWEAGVPTSYWQINESDGEITILTATVTYVNGTYTYIKDENGDNMLLFGSGLGFNKGDLISGDQGGGELEAIYGNLKTYNGLLELEVKDNNFMVEATGQEVTPKTLTDVSKLGDLENMNAYLKVENAVYVSADGRNLTFKVGDTEFIVRQNWTNVSIEGLEEGATYTLEGMGAVYNETKQLYLISFEKTADAPTGIEAVITDKLDVNAPIYNTAGQQVNKDYKGVVIQKGKKILVK